MEFVKHILSRGLPKTGQVTEYVAGDDGTYEAGWWLKRLNANNRTRFVAKTIDGDVVVFDRATGLCWAADGDEAGCNNGDTITWANAIAYANGLDFAGFTDWRVPNINELLSILDFSTISPTITEPPFINTVSAEYWSSTTYSGLTTWGYYVIFDNGGCAIKPKTDTYQLRCVRGGI